MNAIFKLLFLLIGLCSLNVFGACPFSKYTDVVTACAGGNDLGVIYPAGTSKGEVSSFPLRPNKRTGKGYTHGIGCLDETPSPAWYAIKIDEPGNLLLKISHSNDADIDFACWGPFKGETKQAMLENVCANADAYFVDCIVPNTTNICKQLQLEQCESKFAVDPTASALAKVESKEKISDCKEQVERRSESDTDYECFYGYSDAFPIAQMTDCSFSNKDSETCFIGNAKKGEWYIILVTNFSGDAGNITFTKVNGSATTDCSVIVDAESNSPVCEGEDLIFNVNNLPAYASCKWWGPNGFESNEKSPKITNVERTDAGTYYVQITTHDGLKSDEIPVTVGIIPNASVDTTIRIVEGDVVKFKNVELSKAGDYKVPVKYGECTKIFNVKVIVEPLLPAYIEQNGPICEGDSLILSIGDAPTSGVKGYIWNGPNGFYSTLECPVVSKMNQKKAGKYSLKIKKDGLVYPVAPVNVTVIPKIKEKVTRRIPFGESTEFAGKTISQRGVYTATFESSYGCDSVVELILVPDMPILEPDVFFTPNGDGINDVWGIKNIEYYPEAMIRIYDRFGKIVYEATDYSFDNAWNGKDINGRNLPSTDYWYTIDIQSSDRVYYGHVTLLR
ncbi:MAG: T9SS type B sorting domain-containing protein [Paludibacteraceae bacterium]|nr:T9SS type B sorting domain-containing protein [Paludibacteraceae bacterium]